ncbi:nitrilase-related carbon-nitrogen hydrolase, partial [Oleiphilus sp. HI0123]
RQVYHNSIVSLGAREAEGESIYHKQKLVPFGEYVPLEDLLRGLIDFFNLPMSDFRTGAEDQALLKSFDYQVAPFICYEVVYPDFVAKQSADADYLITISNDSWFGTSIGPLQHL